MSVALGFFELQKIKKSKLSSMDIEEKTDFRSAHPAEAVTVWDFLSRCGNKE